jgi:hypothetical protein
LPACQHTTLISVPGLSATDKSEFNDHDFTNRKQWMQWLLSSNFDQGWPRVCQSCHLFDCSIAVPSRAFGLRTAAPQDANTPRAFAIGFVVVSRPGLNGGDRRRAQSRLLGAGRGP